MENLSSKIIYCVLLCLVFTAEVGAQSSPPDSTTAWHDGKFQVDVAGVLSRSSVILSQPNMKANQALPLGNGRLGVAVWSENGLTAQLNRVDTLPDRLSPGRVVIPSLSSLTQAKDYAGRLDLYDGEFQEHGGGMAATAYVQPDTDTLIIDVTGTKVDEPQTAQLKLWEPRTTRAVAKGQVGLLSQGWIDDLNPGASGRPFGALSAIRVEARDVSVVVTDPLTVTVTFKPDADGHFKVVVASPHYDGKLDPLTVARPALSAGTPTAHKSWWHNYWNHVGSIKITSQDGSGEYMENLRNIYLFDEAAEKGDEYPGTQAGVADMLSSAGDEHHWDSASFWHWDLRTQVAANISAGATELNTPYFNLYRENLTNLESWTKTHMNGLPGICVPETMRFNAQGIEYESDWDLFSSHLYARDCDAYFTPFFNTRTLSTGAEVSLWMWQQYLATSDSKFLADNYPFMAASARFLLAYQKLGPDGLLHTGPSNAHETQWDVTDPTTDIAAAMALYPAAIQAAKLLGRDADLVKQLQAALPKIPPLPRTQLIPPHTLLPPSVDADGEDMIAVSYQPGAPLHNQENIELEPLWPYDLIGDTSPLFPLALRTYQHRPFPVKRHWCLDPIEAARLGLGSEVSSTLIKCSQDWQSYVNGLALTDVGNSKHPQEEFYIEQVGIVADALQEALVQDYDGMIRIAPAIPPGWDFDGSVFVRGKTKVDVQVRNGIPKTVVIESGIAQPIKLRNPWPAQALDVISGTTGTKVVDGSAGQVITFKGAAGERYLVQRHGEPTANQRFESISGTPTITAKSLGKAQIGLFNAVQ
jgi:hypothetical protein